MFRLSERSLNRLEGVNDHLIECIERSLSKASYDMTIPQYGGVRTAEEQYVLFDKGYSKCDGYEKLSYHQSGNAADVIPVYKTYQNTKAMNHFAKIMYFEWQKMLKNTEVRGLLEWGGLWGSTGWDKPHYQIIGLWDEK